MSVDVGTDISVTRGGTRWRRSALAFIPAMVGVGVLTAGLLFGVIPLNLAVSGQDLKVSSNGKRLTTPDGIALYPARIVMKDGKPAGVVIAGLPSAELAGGICISLTLTFPVVGTFTVRIRTDEKVVAHDMVLDAASLRAAKASLRGSGKGDPVALGPSVPGGDGRFGVAAGGANTLDGLEASAKGAIIAGTVRLGLPGISIKSGRGTSNGECF